MNTAFKEQDAVIIVNNPEYGTGIITEFESDETYPLIHVHFKDSFNDNWFKEEELQKGSIKDLKAWFPVNKWIKLKTSVLKRSKFKALKEHPNYVGYVKEYFSSIDCYEIEFYADKDHLNNIIFKYDFYIDEFSIIKNDINDDIKFNGVNKFFKAGTPVLVRTETDDANVENRWNYGIYSHFSNKLKQHIVNGKCWDMCIEYTGNEAYIGTQYIKNYCNDAITETTAFQFTFNPGTLVLVRNSNDEAWQLGLFSHNFYINKFVVSGQEYSQCIDYNSHKNLLGTTDNVWTPNFGEIIWVSTEYDDNQKQNWQLAKYLTTVDGKVYAEAVEGSPAYWTYFKKM